MKKIFLMISKNRDCALHYPLKSILYPCCICVSKGISIFFFFFIDEKFQENIRNC